MSNHTAALDIGAKLWSLCHVLRDDGVTYHQYLSELTYLLFLKMMKETGQESRLKIWKGQEEGFTEGGAGRHSLG
jgi:type I restriction enzyme M protein